MGRVNWITLLDKSMVPSNKQLEVDSYIEACGGMCGESNYSGCFPEFVLVMNHSIAHLEMLNLVVCGQMSGQAKRILAWLCRPDGQKIHSCKTTFVQYYCYQCNMMLRFLSLGTTLVVC